MGNSASSQYHNALQRGVPQLKDVNPYEVLGIPKNFEWTQLKEAYRRTALLVHPDKGGSEELFNLVTDCFKLLAEEYKLRVGNKPHHLLKQESAQYYEKQPAPRPPVDNADDTDFNAKFNRLFEENRFKDEDGAMDGYGDQMVKSSGTREDINIERRLDKFNAKRFHEEFDRNVPATREVTIYKEPQPMLLARKIQFTEIAGEKPDDYTSDEKSSLQYTDYMRAYTTSRLIDPKAVKDRREYKNVEEYKRHRARVVDKPMTDAEAQRMEEAKRAQEEAERRNAERIRARDAAIRDYHAKTGSLLLPPAAPMRNRI